MVTCSRQSDSHLHTSIRIVEGNCEKGIKGVKLTVSAWFGQITCAQISPIKLYYADWPSSDYPAPRKESISNAMVISDPCLQRHF